MSVFLSQVTSSLPTIMLIFFFLAFIAILVLTFHPSQKEKMKEHAQIPLKEDDNGSK